MTTTPTQSSPAIGEARELTISIGFRDDGGMRVWSDVLPGLILSGSDRAKVMASILPAIQALIESGAKLAPTPSPASGERGDVRKSRKNERPAIWTYSEEDFKAIGEHLYYFAPANAAPSPYRTQRHVTAILDIADDGTLAGVELIDNMPAGGK